MRQRILLAFLLGGAAAAGAVPVTPLKEAVPEPKISFVGRRHQHGTAMLRFSVETPTRDPGTIFAYLPGPEEQAPAGVLSPLYQIELLRNGKWVSHFLGWCGTGAGGVKLNAASKLYFTVPVPPGEWRAMRAGVSWTSASTSSKARTIWSEPVPRSTLPSKPK